MKNEIYFDGDKYISAKRAAEITGYTSDYVGQLSRTGKVNSKLVGRTRFVEGRGIIEYAKNNSGKVIDEKVREAEKEQKKAERERKAPRLRPVKIFEKAEEKPKTIPFSYILPSPVAREYFQKAATLAVAVVLVFGSYFVLQNRSEVEKGYIAFVESAKKVAYGSDRQLALNLVSFEEFFDYLSRGFRKLAVFLHLTPRIDDSLLVQTDEIIDEREGVVFIPHDEGDDEEAVKQKVRASFSDEVEIISDETGRSGIIKPIFRRLESEPYLYVLVPIEEEEENKETELQKK